MAAMASPPVSPPPAPAPPDAKLIAWLDFPAPPHQLAGGLSAVRTAAGYFALAVLFIVGAGVLIGFFGFSASGRGLLVDSALAAGLGRPLPQARVKFGECSYSGSRAGSRFPGQWRCPATVVDGSERTAVPVETVGRQEDLHALGAGRVFGATGIYWPLGTLAARWWNALFVVAIGGGVLWLAFWLRGMAGEAGRLRRLRGGTVRSADLLTCRGRPWFAFVDDAGERRFAQADTPTNALVLDGVQTTTAALVLGREAVLLHGNLHPLLLNEQRRAGIMERAAQVQHQCRIRRALPPQPGDAPTMAGRIGHIEARLAAKPAAPELQSLYDAAWRLVWDSDDAGIAQRALVARDAIAERLGPAATDAQLQACRSRYAGMAA